MGVVCVCVCVRACVRACVRVCVCVCVRQLSYVRLVDDDHAIALPEVDVVVLSPVEVVERAHHKLSCPPHTDITLVSEQRLQMQ